LTIALYADDILSFSFEARPAATVTFVTAHIAGYASKTIRGLCSLMLISTTTVAPAARTRARVKTVEGWTSNQLVALQFEFAVRTVATMP
jgi:hypothetical protein